MGHYRTMLSSENFCAADLWSETHQQYGETVVQITQVKKGEVIGEKGRKKTMPFVTLKSAKTGQMVPKPLGLNATNCRTLASLAGSPNVERWQGLWITLYVASVDVGREKADAIRIKPELAKPPEGRDAKPTTSSNEQQMSDADKRAIELAEREEGSHG